MSAESRAAFERRRVEFKGLRYWCDQCGAVLCCSSCYLNHRPMCERAAWAYGMTDGEFDRAMETR